MAASKAKPAPVDATRLETPAGGGAFALDRLTVGIFLTDQPEHRFALGTDRPSAQPLMANQGFVLPAGAQGLCLYDNDHSFLAVGLEDRLLREVGLEGADTIAPQIGTLDPLLLQMSLNASAVGDAPNALYRETMQRALAAHIAQTVQTLAPDVQALDDARLRRAVAYIHDHLGEDVSLEVLSGEAAMSAYHFARAFKAALGQSPLQYVIAERMRVAGALLTSTQLPIGDVALRVGYEDTSRFGKHFKRAMGVTPAVYRAGR
ncbi:MAG: helix-turn-helix transcriptional regulator [Devosiaceae bacterium]|nr:helix-turn-helix transcriptional regulator [Devosiaceae bacterium MH13]